MSYPLPSLPELENKPEHKEWLASTIDHHGSIDLVRLRSKKHYGNKVYYYEYYIPKITYTNTTRALANKVARLTEAKIYEIKGQPPYLL